MADPEEWVESQFPNLAAKKAYQVESEATEEYNCIAWCVGIDDQWWWPEHDGTWPEGVPRENTLTNFITALSRLGYQPCEDSAPEEGFGKVIIYIGEDGAPTHMARQLPNGAWTSKLGNAWDIRHDTPQGLENSAYGTVAQALKRPL